MKLSMSNKFDDFLANFFTSESPFLESLLLKIY